MRTADACCRAIWHVSPSNRWDVQSMLSQPEQAILNLEQARDLRAAGRSYREIRRQLALTSSQIGLIRRTLKRAKASHTRLRSTKPGASERDLPVSQSVLPAGLRKRLITSGFRTLGDLEDRLSEPNFPGLRTLPGIGPHREQLVLRMLDHFALLPGRGDLQAAIEQLFPEFEDKPQCEAGALIEL